MGVLNATQTGKDGVGKVKTLSGLSAVRLKAKEVSSTKNTTLKVTGNTTGTSWTIGVVVETGNLVSGYTPPAVNMNPSPTSAFTYTIDEFGV
jgi:hypothetical protein|tara:strand:+ start:4749 stop:5024 length:276 start_codon:yes stop_codon:yes gene_type:complete